MRPKLLHWCVIGWIDDDPDVALCLNVRQLSFYFPSGNSKFGYPNGVEEIDSSSQVLAVLDKPHVPVIPSKLIGKRLKDDKEN